MDTPMLQMDLSILISNPIKKSLNMENLKELRMLKLKLNKDSTYKKDPRDFALWKAAKPAEPKWPSPWG